MKRIITSEPDSLIQYLKKIWEYRSLVMVFARRDLKVKYAQTLLGLGWTIIQPLTGLFIFTFFFGYILNLNAQSLPFPLYVLSGLLGWNYFSYIVFQGIGGVQESGHFIRKVYFPKSLLPLSKVLVGLVELSVSFLLLIPLLMWYGEGLSWRIIFIPVLLLFNTLIALFVVFLVTSFSYRLRDLYHLVPFVMYFGIWITPVFFTIDVLPEQLHFLWFLNPMASVVEGWRWCLFSDWAFNIRFLPALLCIIPAFLFSVVLYSKAESKFSDFA